MLVHIQNQSGARRQQFADRMDDPKVSVSVHSMPCFYYVH